MKPPFPSDAAGFGEPAPGDSHDFEPADSARIARFGLFLFLVSLGMLFGASLLGYLMYRLDGTLPLHQMRMPVVLAASTALLLMAGVAMTLTARRALHSSTTTVRRAMGWTWALSAAFVAVQAPGIWQLAASHHQQVEKLGLGLYGFALTLIVIHALHVVGGMIPLSVLTWRAFRRPLVLEDRQAIRRCAAYWHFLEAVWLVMYSLFVLLG